MRRLADAEKPVVAAPLGPAIGASVGLLLLCDRVVGGPSTRISLPFIRLALVPDWGLPFTLPRRVGEARARRLLLDGLTLTGEEALEWGLLDELVADERVEEAAIERAVALAGLPRLAFAQTKQLLRGGRGLEQALDLEAAAQSLSLISGDAGEGRAAFFEKRSPNFQR